LTPSPICPLSLRRSRPAGNLTATSNDGRIEQRQVIANRGDGTRPAAPGLTTLLGPSQRRPTTQGSPSAAETGGAQAQRSSDGQGARQPRRGAGHPSG